MKLCSYLDCEAETSLVYRNFAVCEDHFDNLVSIGRSAAVQAAEYHQLYEFPGICYVVLLPDGSVKIGYTNTEKLYRKRMSNLKSKYQAPVIQLTRLKGGFVAEAYLHERFKESRLPGVGERFAYSAEIADFIEANNRSLDVQH